MDEGRCPPLLRLRCEIQHNEWGKRGSKSFVRRLALATSPELASLPESEPFAELWIGVHPKLPSRDFSTNRPLREIIESDPQIQPWAPSRELGTTFPFLLKVLSINIALSIQAHPDHKLAQELHTHDPMEIINLRWPLLSHISKPFTDFVQSRRSVISYITSHASREVLGPEATSEISRSVRNVQGGAINGREQAAAAVKKAFLALLETDNEKLEIYVTRLVVFAKTLVESEPEGRGIFTHKLARLVLQVHSQHGNDVGIFLMLFMNHVVLEPGEAMFLESGELHAYLEGDVIEYMTSSNNILRTGFTKKFRHIRPLGSLLSYNHRDTPKIEPVPDPNVRFTGSDPLDGSYCLIYRSWTDEYHVLKIVLGHRSIQATCWSIPGPSILICTQGKGTLTVDDQTQQVKLGFVFFVNTAKLVAIGNSGEEELVLYRACCG